MYQPNVYTGPASNLFPGADLAPRFTPNGLRGADRAQPRFDYELIRTEGGHLDYARTFFAYPTKNR